MKHNSREENKQPKPKRQPRWREHLNRREIAGPGIIPAPPSRRV